MAANEVSFNVRDHGIALDNKKQKVKCNYCGKVVSGFSRLKCHLGGKRGDVTPCEEVPADLREIIRNELHEKKRGSLTKEVGNLTHPNLPWKRNWYPNSNDVNHNKLKTTQSTEFGANKPVEVDSMSENTEWVPSTKKRIGSQTAVNGVEEDSTFREVQKCIGRFCYETGIDFHAVASPSFQRMINATLACGQTGYKIPSSQELKGRILMDEVKEMNQYVKDVRDCWASTGCSIILDGWIDGKGRNLVNILVDCPRGPIYLRSYDISASIRDVDALQLLLDEVIEEVGVENVVQIVTFSVSVFMETVGKQLMEKHRTIFWTVSASHCIELMLEKIGKMDFIKEILEKAKNITKFVHSHAKVLKLFKQLTNGCDLVKPSKLRSAMPFLTLENIVSEREILAELFGSFEWNSSSKEGKRVSDWVTDPSFWSGAKMVLDATIPLVRVLDWIHDGDMPQLGFIYETIDQAKERIKEQLKNKKSQYMPLWRAVDEIWNKHLHSPLHSAGYFLNPCLFYTSDFYTDPEVASGLCCCIVRMVEDKHVQDLVTLQVDEYRRAKGDFGKGSASDRLSNIPPALWWSNYGGKCPELQRLAMRILSQTCNGASKYDLKRGLAEKLLTKGRNRIEQQQLSDLAFVHYNLQLRNFEFGEGTCIGVEDIDPMDDWIVDEAVCENDEPTWMDLDCGNTSTNRCAGNGEEIPSVQPKEETG